MTPYLTNVDPGDEDLALPPPTKVCLMCQGQGVFYRAESYCFTTLWSQHYCVPCNGTGRVRA